MRTRKLAMGKRKITKEEGREMMMKTAEGKMRMKLM